MSIKKLIIDGKPIYEVFIKIRDKSGKQIAKRKRFDNEKEARKAEYEFLNNLEGHKNKITWKAWVATVLEKYKVEYVNSTYLNYKYCLNKWFDPIWNERFVEDIKPSEVHEAIFVRCTLSSSYTKRGLLKIVKRVFSLAIDEGILSKNPAVGIRIKCADANQGVLNRNEVDILLLEARRHDHRFFKHWTLAILTGMRSGELFSLRWSDIDFVNGKISVNKAWTRYNGEGTTKTAKNRVVPMNGECRKFLKELKGDGSDNSEYVLPRIWEWMQGEQAKILKDFCKEIGITPVKFHDLRATFITQMLNNGVPLSKVMSIVGHSSLKTTQGYLRLSGKDVEGATESLNIKVPAFQDNSDNVVALFPG